MVKLYRVLLPGYRYKNDFAALGPARAQAKAKGQAMAAAEEGNWPIISIYLFSCPFDWYRIQIKIGEFEARVKKQTRELTALQARHDEKKNEMETLGKDCQKIVCRYVVVF